MRAVPLALRTGRGPSGKCAAHARQPRTAASNASSVRWLVAATGNFDRYDLPFITVISDTEPGLLSVERSDATPEHGRSARLRHRGSRHCRHGNTAGAPTHHEAVSCDNVSASF